MPDHPDRPDRSNGSRPGHSNPLGDPLTDPRTDAVSELLLDAFDHDVRTQPVDEQRLTAGTRTRLRHRRRVRRAQFIVAAVVIVGAVPLSIQAWPTAAVRTTPATTENNTPNRPSPFSSAPATTLPTTSPTRPTDQPSTSSPTSTSSDTGAAGPIPTTAPADPHDVAYDIPDLTRMVAAFPVPLTSLDDTISGSSSQYAKNPTVSGQGCSEIPYDPPQIAGRQWSWAKVKVDENGGVAAYSNYLSIDTVVTGWAPGTGQQAFQVMLDDDNPTCRFMEAQTPFAFDVAGADQSWAARSTDGFGDVTNGAARVGDLIVAVTLHHPSAEGDTDLANLLAAAVTDLRTSGLSAAHGA